LGERFIKDVIEPAEAAERARKDKAADRSWRRCQDDLANYKQRRQAADQARKATDADRRQKAEDAAAYQRVMASEAQQQKVNADYSASLKAMKAKLSGEAVDAAPPQPSLREKADALWQKPTPAFSERAAREIPQRGFSRGMSQEKICEDARAKHEAMGRKLRGEKD
jgi:hypothetical protein